MKCNRCHKEYVDSRLSCPHCGARKKTETKTLPTDCCPGCDEHYDLNLAFCPGCGRAKSSVYKQDSLVSLVPVDITSGVKKRVWVPLIISRESSVRVDPN